jgi:hypothetical protein
MISKYPVHGVLFSAAKVLEASLLHKVDPRRAECIQADSHILHVRHVIEEALRPPPMAACNGTAHKQVRLSKREPHGPDSENAVNRLNSYSLTGRTGSCLWAKAGRPGLQKVT